MSELEDSNILSIGTLSLMQASPILNPVIQIIIMTIILLERR